MPMIGQCKPTGTHGIAKGIAKGIANGIAQGLAPGTLMLKCQVTPRPCFWIITRAEGERRSV
jgi:hypothetical protein